MAAATVQLRKPRWTKADNSKASQYCLVKAAALALRSICCGHSVAVAIAVTFQCTYTHTNDNSNHGSIDGCFLTFFLSAVAFAAADVVTLLPVGKPPLLLANVVTITAGLLLLLK